MFEDFIKMKYCPSFVIATFFATLLAAPMARAQETCPIFIQYLSTNKVVLTWTNGILQSATNVHGPYVDVPGATSPFTNTTLPPPLANFYRLQCSCPGQDIGVACNTGKPGICAAGTTACVGGAIACVQNQQPSAEVCNGLDDDCNGVVDNGNPGGGVACNTGKLGICAAGTTACVGGAITCVQNQQPTAEVCDGLDDDCDGQVDEGNPGGGVACNTGKLGICAAGTTACVGGAITCVQNQQPSAEVCNGLDDDCNGVVDNGNPGGGVACNTGKPGICAAGTTACVGGAIACEPNQPGCL